MREAAARFARDGFAVLPVDARSLAWVAHVRPVALAAVADPANAGWLRCGGTWFAGVNLLPNDATGAVAGGPPMGGPAVDLLHALGWAGPPFDRAQISVVHPGYPRPQPGESEAAFRFRRDRDAAHVDGILPVGPERRRMAQEAHAFILGVALTETGEGASPLVVWAGSHRIVEAAFAAAFAGHPPEAWPAVDLTDSYHAARRTCFETCPRVEVHMRPGEAVLLHPQLLHGIAPWREGASAPPEGRVVAYFRPAPG